MYIKALIRPNSYYDSVTLMRISGKASEVPGVIDVLVGMGTELNKASLINIGITSKDIDNATPNDLIIGIKAENENAIESALKNIEDLFSSKIKKDKKKAENKFQSIEQVAQLNEGFNIAVISVPGVYAAREAEHALRNGMHVFMFSDNVSVEDEFKLKNLAIEKGLLMMGPDCGTAIINGIPLGFANRVRKGNIGIIGASGTGTQQISTLIDLLGGGVSQVIGTGGRDLSARIGGLTTLAALDALGSDEETSVIVIISKPPAEEVARRVLEKARKINKKVVLCLLGMEKQEAAFDNIIQCSNLEETALTAVSLAAGKKAELSPPANLEGILENFNSKRKHEQRYVRALFGGGTLCDEAMTVFRRKGIKMHSNIPLDENEALKDTEISEGNTFLDMGDDYFTKGKPHPMIEPGLRTKRIINEAEDNETAVILLDVELGHGCHPDPAGIVLEAANKANERLRAKGRCILWIASLIGTTKDPQGMDDQIKKLENAGFIVFESNVRAAEFAASLAD